MHLPFKLPSPPHHDHPTPPTQFLSHFKQEAGSDARYLNDLLQRMLQAKCYLDVPWSGFDALDPHASPPLPPPLALHSHICVAYAAERGPA